MKTQMSTRDKYIVGAWKQLKDIARQLRGKLSVTTPANDRQLAEWLARQHKIDPIHK
jgi:hypothetical protein